MSYKIDEIEGIGPSYRERLQKAGVDTTDDLLNSCASPAGRKEMAEKTGLTEKQILGWTNMADLMRVSGVGRQYAELLEAAGVDTIKELRNRNAANLAASMQSVNKEKKLAKTAPSSTTVEKWIGQAKVTEPKISY
jgi:predicted flap endonuclease-1-like 5' DNA nuclease